MVPSSAHILPLYSYNKYQVSSHQLMLHLSAHKLGVLQFNLILIQTAQVPKDPQAWGSSPTSLPQLQTPFASPGYHLLC